MITFIEDPDSKTKIVAKIETGYPVETWTTSFTFDAPSEFYRKLLLNNIRSKMDKLIHDIKEDAYNKGYKDGRAKKVKRTWFSILFRKDP